MQHKLFQGLATHALLHVSETVDSPWPLARYVTRQLPADVRALTCGHLDLPALARTHQSLLQQAEGHILAIDDADEAALVQLDMLMLLGCYLPAKDQAYALAPA